MAFYMYLYSTVVQYICINTIMLKSFQLHIIPPKRWVLYFIHNYNIYYFFCFRITKQARMDPELFEDMMDIPGVIYHTFYTFWFNQFTISKVGLQTGRIGVRVVIRRFNGVTTIESINAFREPSEWK